jgi:hypothetical protein
VTLLALTFSSLGITPATGFITASECRR